jgi:hypothetical protein
VGIAWNNETVAAIVGALVGSILTAGVSLFISKKTNKIKRVDCIVNDASSLLSFADTIRNDLEVTYTGERVNSVLLFNLEVFSSGNEAIENQPVRIRLDKSAKIVGYTLRTEPEIGFGEIRETKRENCELDLIVELLNPRDRVYIELISVNNDSDTIDVYMKNANVDTRIYTRRAAENAILGTLNQKVDLTLISLAILRSLPIFGGLAEPFMTIVLTERFEKALRQKK